MLGRLRPGQGKTFSLRLQALPVQFNIPSEIGVQLLPDTFLSRY